MQCIFFNNNKPCYLHCLSFPACCLPPKCSLHLEYSLEMFRCRSYFMERRVMHREVNCLDHPREWGTEPGIERDFKGQSLTWCRNPLPLLLNSSRCKKLSPAHRSPIYSWVAFILFNESQFKKKVPQFSWVLIQFPVHYTIQVDLRL